MHGTDQSGIWTGFYQETKMMCQGPKVITGLDREFSQPLQLHATNQGCCTAAKVLLLQKAVHIVNACVGD